MQWMPGVDGLSPQLGSVDPPAHRDGDVLPLTQTAPDDESEAEKRLPGRETPGRRLLRCAPGRIRTYDIRFRSLIDEPCGLFKHLLTNRFRVQSGTSGSVAICRR